MCSEVFLAWHEHQNTLVGVFEKLLASGTFVDCTIAAEGQYLKAHKIVLSACSPYFEMLFRQENEKNPIVILKDIKFQELKAVIDFIYTGKVIVPQKHLENFVDAAKSLQIKGLEGVNQRKNNPKLAEIEYPPVVHNKGDHVSPQPRKRCRRFYSNNNGDNIRGISPVIDLNVETKTDQVILSRGTHLDVPSSSEIDPCPPLTTLSETSIQFPSSESSEQENLETKESISFVEEPIVPETDQLPDVHTVVVKNEPEATDDMFLPEIDCFVEPKDADLQETVLDSGVTKSVTYDSQPGSNQYSALSTALQASSSVESAAGVGMSDNLLLMTDLEGSFSNQGAETFNAGAFINKNKISTGYNVDVCTFEDNEPQATRNTAVIPSPIARTAKVIRRNAALPSPVATTKNIILANATLSLSEASDPNICQLSRTNGGSSRSYSCYVCRNEFKLFSSLAYHNRLHPQEKPIKCRDCSESFKQGAHLHLAHRNDEMGKENLVKSVKCQECGKTFKNGWSLREHMRTHTDDRPFDCEVCGSTFRHKSTLNIHLQTHTGEKPCKCNLCDYAATHYRYLKSHMRNFHKIYMFKQSNMGSSLDVS